MPKISLVNNSGEVLTVFLKTGKTCPIDNCGYEKECAGKNSRRDNDFVCSLRDLISLYKENKER